MLNPFRIINKTVFISNMNQVFGKFNQQLIPENNSLELSFTSNFQPTKHNWRNNRLFAYFIADYFSNLLTIDENDAYTEEQIKNIKSTVSYIGNELLENAVKFHENIQNHHINLGIYLLAATKNTAVIYTKNIISTEAVKKYQSFINSLMTNDPNELYIQQIETTASEENSQASGLGLLTLINDYSAKLGWKFESEPNYPEIITVTTMTQVIV
jgi:hypothetical protein